jgi:hypothetical protein
MMESVLHTVNYGQEVSVSASRSEDTEFTSGL